MASDRTVDATFYCQIEPEWSAHNAEMVVGAKVARVTRHKPDRPVGGTVTVRLTVRIPAVVFGPLRPDVVVLPESLAEANPVDVTADDPTEERP